MRMIYLVGACAMALLLVSGSLHAEEASSLQTAVETERLRLIEENRVLKEMLEREQLKKELREELLQELADAGHEPAQALLDKDTLERATEQAKLEQKKAEDARIEAELQRQRAEAAEVEAALQKLRAEQAREKLAEMEREKKSVIVYRDVDDFELDSLTSVMVVSDSVPALRVERQSRAPGRDYVWRSGYWTWSHGRYVWVDGEWVRPVNSGYVWYAPRCVLYEGRYYYYSGFWGPSRYQSVWERHCEISSRFHHNRTYGSRSHDNKYSHKETRVDTHITRPTHIESTHIQPPRTPSHGSTRTHEMTSSKDTRREPIVSHPLPQDYEKKDYSSPMQTGRIERSKVPAAGK